MFDEIHKILVSQFSHWEIEISVLSEINMTIILTIILKLILVIILVITLVITLVIN